MPRLALATHREFWTVSCSLAVAIVAVWLMPRATFAQTPIATFEPFTLSTRAHGNVAAELGTLRVPRRHAVANGETLSLQFVRLRAVRPSGAPPVIYLAGGPGGSGIDAATGVRWPVFDAVRQHVDVILLDQRGTGRSEPPPPCPPAPTPVWPSDRALSAHEAYAAMEREARRCAAAWRAAGVDLDAYSTVESARDIDWLRQALRAERVALWGMSYGTHLALATMRIVPGRVARVVLMGTEGPDHTLKRPLDADRQLLRLHAWAAEDRVARELTPDLLGSLHRALARLDSTPLTIPQPGASPPLVLGAFDLQLVVAGMLGRAQTNALIPVLLNGIERGDGSLFAQLALSIRRQAVRVGAMPLAMDAASGATPARRLMVTEEEHRSVLGRALNFPWPQFGDSIGVTDLGDGFRAPLTSRTRALFVSGTFDGRTPVENAREIMRGFRKPKHLILEQAGHDDELWTSTPVVREWVAAFLTERSVEPSWLRRLFGRRNAQEVVVPTALLRVPGPPGGA